MSSNSKETQAVIANHLGEFFKANIDGVVQDYAADSVLIVRDGPRRGQEIRGFFSDFIGALPAGFLEAFKMHRQEFVGELGYIVWEALPWVSLGTDTFVVRDGKIVMQTFACHPVSW